VSVNLAIVTGATSFSSDSVTTPDSSSMTACDGSDINAPAGGWYG
jgi:hypothetical protein